MGVNDKLAATGYEGPMQSWRDKMAKEHQRTVEAGEHDDRCEWRDAGHFLCNCKYRARIASGYTEAPGQLIHQYPTCPRCYDETSHDGDSFTCEPCGVHWPEPHSEKAVFYEAGDPLDTSRWDNPTSGDRLVIS